MFAIIRTGGKQYSVSPGDVVRVEKLPGQVGEDIELKDVLMVNDGTNLQAGQPVLADATVVAEIVGHGKAKKVTVFKMKRRKGYHKKQGHRQEFTSLKIKEIKA
ncbi:MAG: 50S ribosomal protein L21 [Deltaproteobacteria bacterium]|nr:50S ribosomal protein L21 [Deltaproteobacteria bacterium]